MVKPDLKSPQITICHGEAMFFHGEWACIKLTSRQQQKASQVGGLPVIALDSADVKALVLGDGHVVLDKKTGSPNFGGPKKKPGCIAAPSGF